MVDLNLRPLYLSLGSNLQDKEKNLQTAIRLISERIGIVTAESSIYETEPWGFESSNTFYNMAIRVETNLSPIEILHITQEIEKAVGRKEKTQRSYQDRIIDIDLILYGDLVVKTAELKLPHPLFHLRKFVLEPLCEIASDVIHPIYNKKISTFLD